mmetsp:Transcript_21622/g.41309  ORF Transcript_21622/g.41309 Transcript_21622/m.41309 type:complete len:545 (-) Transcript_21622:350-1984(-)
MPIPGVFRSALCRAVKDVSLSHRGRTACTSRSTRAPPCPRKVLQAATPGHLHSLPGSSFLGTPSLPSLRPISMEASSSNGPRAAKKRRADAAAASLAASLAVPHTVGPTVKVQGLTLTDHTFKVPLDHTGEMAGSIDVFVREVVATGRAEDLKLPYLVYFTGGPGFECPRPSESGGWLSAAVDKFRVLLLDQRGTGRSTPVTTSSVLARGDARQQAAYLQNFRADSIVRDVELIRKSWLSESVQLTTLGQSFGGFCTLTYLSMAPEGLERCLITGGLSPVVSGCSADMVYSSLFNRVMTQNAKYYQRFPQDVQQVGKIVLYIKEQGGKVPLPGGGVLSAQGLQWLGISLGFAGGMEQLHFLFETAFDGSGGLSHVFLRSFENMLSVDTNPIYAILHESIYCQGAASNWSANRMLQERHADFNAVDAAKAGRPVLLTGEMIFPFLFDEIPSLKPLKEAANLLAEKSDWPQLYNVDVLRNNRVPVAAAAYYEDMYVEFVLSQQTAEVVKGIRLWVTSEYMHSGIREDGARVFSRLMAMTDDELPVR